MLERTHYPLLVLKCFGTVCPCLEREEDGPARKAAWAISSNTIRWHRRLRPSSSTEDCSGQKVASSVSGFISGFFGGAGSSASEDTPGGSSLVRYEPVEGAYLSVADSSSGPILIVNPPNNDIGSIRNKRIPLKMIKTVHVYTGGILNALVASRSGIEILDYHGQELLRFDVLKSFRPNADDDEADAMSTEVEDAEEKSRDDVIDRLEILVEWDRRRQAHLVSLGEEYESNADHEELNVSEFDDDEEQSVPTQSRTTPSKGKRGGVIAERARKIQHFAQREIEMQKTKQERENRKAKYVKEAGGLKYTAIAMANRS